jgi:acyl-CoA synthetase (NDP forming)
LETLKLLDNGGRVERARDRLAELLGRRGVAGGRSSEHGPLRFEPFSDEHRHRIESTLTELVTVSNPFDYHTFMWGDRAAIAKCFTAVMDGPRI